MKKTFLFFVALFCSLIGTSLFAQDQEIDCSFSKKGCLLKRESETVVIFFRGWVSPSEMHRYRGLRKQIEPAYWTKSAKDLLTRGDMIVGNANLTSSVFATGSSHVALTMDEMDSILEKANAKYLIFASHSGGWKGLRNTLLPAKLSYWDKLIGVWLLDNYYSNATLSNDLKRNLGTEFLRENCYGFTTQHNLARYKATYQSICPKTKTSGVTHSGGVLQCMPWFENHQECGNSGF